MTASDPRRDPRALPPGEPVVEAARLGAMAPAESDHIRGYPVEDEATHFWDYWRVVRRRRWTIISCFLVTAIAGTLWTFTQRPLYTASATVRIDKEEPRVIKFDKVVDESETAQDYYQTQYRLLQSRTLANRVIGLLQLDQHPEFQAPEREQGWRERARAWARESFVRWIPMPPPPAPEATEEVLLTSPLTGAFLSRLSIEPIRSSRLVKVSFDSHHPDLSARVPNTLAEAFIAQQLDHKIEATRYATQFLAKQVDETRDRLSQAETRLSDFLNLKDILFVSADRSVQTQDLVTRELTQLLDALLKARAERIARESVLAEASGRSPDALTAVLQSPVVTSLKQQLAGLESDYRRLAQVFKPDYPKMQQLNEKIVETQRHLQGEVERSVQALQTDYDSAVRYEREIEAAVARQHRLARGLSESMAEYNLLRRDVDTSRDLYAALLARLRETQISSALFTSNISIVDRAEVPATPSRPNRSQNLFIACVLGLMGGVALAFVREYLDTNIRDAKEVESVLRVPILGLVPTWRSHNGHRRAAITEGPKREPQFALVAHAEIASALAESFRHLRTSLLYSSPDHPPKTIMVTSLQPEDGKTSLVTNLAITLAQLGAGEVLMVDADMRRPNLHEVLEVRQAPGLSTFLTGQARLDEVVVPTPVPGLSVIPSGRNPINPAELLASSRFRQAIEALGQRFAHIVFDTGPLFGVSDALILSGQVEGVVLVLRQGRASRDAAQRAIRNLMSVRSRLLGVILNDVDVHGQGYYGYYGAYEYGHAARQDSA